MKRNYLSVFSASLLTLALAGVAPAQAQFPTKPITIVPMSSGFPATTTRMLVAEMSTMINQSIIVDPKPGASGMLASQYVAKQAPDGYTILIGTNSTHAANQSLFKSVPYDSNKDFAPISGVSQGMLLVTVNAQRVAAKTVAELTALAKSQPGKLNYGWGASSPRASMELYKQITGVNIVDVPYKSNPQATTDLVAGRIDIMISDFVTLTPHVQSGKLRALAVSGTQRSSKFPDLPTMQEAGVSGYGLTFWLAAYAPAGTPPEVVNRLNKLFVDSLKRPKVVAFLDNVGSFAFPTTPDELKKFQISEQEKWRKIIVTAGIKPQ